MDTENMKLDYDLVVGLEEWAGGTYRITDDFYRLIIYTDRMQKKLWRFFGKMVPLGCAIKLDRETVDELRRVMWYDKDFYSGLCGTYHAYRVKAFTLDTFYGHEDALATEDEINYEYEWSDL